MVASPKQVKPAVLNTNYINIQESQKDQKFSKLLGMDKNDRSAPASKSHTERQNMNDEPDLEKGTGFY